MHLKTTLIGSAAVGAVLTLGIAGGADAKTSKHHRRPAGPSASEQALRSEVDELKSEVKTLEGRLDSQAAAQQQSAAQIQAAQAQAQAAQNTAQAAQTQVASQQAQIETIPAQVEAKTKRYEPLLTGWFNNTKIGLTVFSDLSYISNKNDGVTNSQSGVNFDIKRAYIVIDHKFNDRFAANLTTDFQYDATAKATQLYIKKAYFEYKVADKNALTVRAGSSDMPWVPFVEGLYGYRFVDKTLIDNISFGTSADWGVHVFGTLFDKHLGYAFSVVDGAGYKSPSVGTVFNGPANINGRPNTMDFEGRVNVNYSNFTLAVGGYVGKLAMDFDGPTSPPTFHTATRLDVLGAYTTDRFRIGVEYMYADFWKDVLQSNPRKTNTTDALSVFASYNFTHQWSIFGRYDYVKPQQDTNPAFNSNFFNVGVDYKPIGPLDLALVYKHENVTDGLLSTGNGSIGTLSAHSPPLGKGTYDEVGIFTQMKF